MSEKNLKDADLLTVIVQNLVDNPGSVFVERSTDEKGVLLTLHVDARDMGKVIGKVGATAQALRLILRGKGRKENATVSVKIAEPENDAINTHGVV